jgi:hypothetical protein
MYSENVLIFGLLRKSKAKLKDSASITFLKSVEFVSHKFQRGKF